MHLFPTSGRALLAILALSLGFIFTSAHAGTVNTFDDIDFWTGTGSNESALVIQWNDGNTPVSLAWGFRWDDANATVETMILALAGSITGNIAPTGGGDSRLSFVLAYYSGLGYSVDGIGYNQAGLAGMSQVQRNQAGYNPTTESYWAYFLGTPSETFNNTFTLSFDYGISGTTLTNNGWYGLSYTQYQDDFTFATPEAAPAAVPEPSTVVLFVIAGGIVWLRIRRHARASQSVLAH